MLSLLYQQVTGCFETCLIVGYNLRDILFTICINNFVHKREYIISNLLDICSINWSMVYYVSITITPKINNRLPSLELQPSHMIVQLYCNHFAFIEAI